MLTCSRMDTAEDVLWRAVPTHPAEEGGVAAMDGVRAVRLFLGFLLSKRVLILR